MVPANRNQISLYEDTKAGLKSLIQQTAQVFVGFIIMLLVTGGNPSGLVVGLSFCLGVGFVAWSEKNRLEEINSSFKRILYKNAESRARIDRVKRSIFSDI